MNILKWERAFLILFLGNYIINNVAVGIASLFPAGAAGAAITMQYIVFVILAAIVSGLLTWWYFCHDSSGNLLKTGAAFGVFGFVIWIATTLISGISGVLAQTGSLAQVASVLPNFGPFLLSKPTLIALGYWIIPALLVGWMLQMKSKKNMTSPHTTMSTTHTTETHSVSTTSHSM